MIRSSKSPP